MGKELISRVFRRDFHQILEFDIFELVDDLNYLREKEYFNILFIDAFTAPLKQLHVNLLEIVVAYLEYDPERFPNPIDQYVHIYENQDKILEILDRNFAVENPFDCPFSYCLQHTLKTRFYRLFRHILTVGKTHKFDEEYIMEHILWDSDGQETD